MIFVTLWMTAIIAVRKIDDIDLWWHLQIGTSILDGQYPPDWTEFYFSDIAGNPDTVAASHYASDALFAMSFRMAGLVGPQFIVLVCLLSLFLVISRRAVRANFTHVLLVAVAVLASYQLSLVRNAVFGALGLAVYLVIIHRAGKDARYWYLVVPLVAAWSWFHGSFLIVLGTLPFLVAGQIIDCSRDRAPLKGPCHAISSWCFATAFALVTNFQATALVAVQPIHAFLLVVVALALMVTARYQITFPVFSNRVIGGLYVCLATVVVTYVALKATDSSMIVRTESGFETMGSLSVPMRIAHAFNNTVWRSAHNTFGSIDFLSPFEFLRHCHVIFSGVLILIGAVAVWLYRHKLRHQTVWFWLAFTLFGLGYVRTIGFAALISAWTIFEAGAFYQKTLSKVSLGFLLILIPYVTWAAFFAPKSIGFYPTHQPGMGPAPFFSSQMPAYIEANFPSAKPFTTLGSGGYLSWKWQHRIPVFIDGFYAPHSGSTLDTYNRSLAAGNARLLEKKGCDLAILNIWDRRWIDLFNGDPLWVPVAIDRGFIAFAPRAALPPDGTLKIQLLLETDALNELPPYLNKAVTFALLETPKILRDHHYPVTAAAMQSEPLHEYARASIQD
ncbi:MAG: hypothetical protein KDC35_18380 [Acidobacteria bacterium]|nr:hypothetical protein [Acidobacteriota bacterium]